MFNFLRSILKFQIFYLALSLMACGVAMDDGDASSAPDASISPDAFTTPDAKEAAQIVTPDAGTPGSDADNTDTDTAPVTCENGCFLGSACVTPSPEQCGRNSACVRCPAAPDTQCQAPTCTDGRCGIVNVADGTGCQGGICRSGACWPCGGANDRCCQTSNGYSCTPGNTCVVSGSFNMCTSCGGLGQPCCGGVGTIIRNPDGTSSPVSYGGTCSAGGTCDSGLCACGKLGQACCTGGCSQGHCNINRVCGV